MDRRIYFGISLLALLALGACKKKAAGGATESPKAPQNCKQIAKSSLHQTRYVTAHGGLRARNAPNRDGKIVALFPYRTEVSVTGTAGERETIGGKTACWFEVRAGSKRGYVFAGYLDSKRPPVCLAIRSMKDFTHGCLGEDCALDDCTRGNFNVHFRRDRTVSIRDGGCHAGLWMKWSVKNGTLVARVAGKSDFGCSYKCALEEINNDKPMAPCVKRCGPANKAMHGREFIRYSATVTLSGKPGGPIRTRYSFKEIGSNTGHDLLDTFSMLHPLKNGRFECLQDFRKR